MSLISTKLLMFDLRGLSLIRVLHNNTRTSVLLRSYYKTDNNVVSSRSIATFFTKKCHGRSSCPVLTRNWDLLTFSTTCRGYSSDNNNSGGGAAAVKEGEIKIKSILSKSFPNAKEIIVEDISGGCGSMYQVYVEAEDFKGLSIVKQHQLVNKVLSQEIKAMHGIRIQTQVPS